MLRRFKQLDMVTPERALPGRTTAIPVADRHTVLGTPLQGPWPAGMQVAVFGMGCFWGAEKDFWEHENVWSTAVGYAGGITPYPTYEETCTGRTGHAEVVLVNFDPEAISYAELLSIFFENHDPTQGMRQGNDIGSQYRSAIFYTSEEQRSQAEAAAEAFGKRLAEAG